MSRFKKKSDKGVPEMNTSALPDIIFMLLFFFMVTTTMRETSLYVQISKPMATEIQKLEKKSLVSYIYVGPPLQTNVYGTEPRIQLNDSYAELKEIKEFVTKERDSKDEVDKPFITTSLKVDKGTKMGIVSDIKIELRKASALKINYSTTKTNKIEF